MKSKPNTHLGISLQDLRFLRTDKLDVGEDRTLQSGQGAIGIQISYQLKRTLQQFQGERAEELVSPQLHTRFWRHRHRLLNSQALAVPLVSHFLLKLLVPLWIQLTFSTKFKKRVIKKLSLQYQYPVK